MREINNKLKFLSNADATVYFHAEGAAGIRYLSGHSLSYRLSDAWGNELVNGHGDNVHLLLPGSGEYRLTFIGKNGDASVITLFCDDAVLPYMMPGVGVLWEHGGVFPLLLDREIPHSLWVISADGDTSEAIAVVKGIDYGKDVTVSSDGEPFTADWYPKMERPWFWHSAKLPSAKITEIELPKSRADARFTVYNRTVAALAEPGTSIPFGGIVPSVTAEDGKPIDARIEVFVGSERVALCDRLTEDSAPIYLPYGRYRVKVSHGMFFSESECTVDVNCDVVAVGFVLGETVKLPQGWLLGELHTHSSLEDATLFPGQVMRAARACGRNFCFMTDKRVEFLDSFGLHDCDKDGVFLGIPGQEIMCHELHTNVLNPEFTINNPEAEDLTAVNPDIEDKIASWLSQYREMKKERSCLIMHNHPTHRAEVAKRGKPYFRSWWVSDLFAGDYHLVENCGYEGWFDRLNRGHRIYAAWTGDGHDCTLMYPGMEGVCVYTGGDLSEAAIIGALEAGRFFSCRAPGAFIDIKKRNSDSVLVAVRASLPISVVEIVADGTVIAAVDGESRLAVEITKELPDGVRWCMARVKLCGGDWDAARYSFTPFMEDGYAAFTNPVYIND